MSDDKIEIIEVKQSEKAHELRSEIIKLINRYNEVLTGYELIGVIDTIREDCHSSIQKKTNS